MPAKEETDHLDYPEKAFLAMNEMMSHNRRHMMDDLNRANKGELFVLHFLQTQNKEVLPSELSAALGASTARISALLGVLEKKGHIVREIDKNNRRNILVTITPKGRKRSKLEGAQAKKRMTQVFMEMGETDTAEFIRLTRLFFELMHSHLPEEGCGAPIE